ncbi:unnamed protein product [Durusdinium trenchii]|uniref:Uncharacterized protein n=1 Tax=Durusdinium trenchii TaxID=1381693 RepID=A0ABP0QA11_9DINO
MPVDVAPVVQAWMECPTIIQRAAVQKLMSFELGPTPEAAESHALVLAPVMKHLGLKPSIDVTRDCVNRLFTACKPFGKKDASSSTVKKTAWYIRKLVTAWRRFASRGHVPRSRGHRMLFEAAEIPWPERSDSGSFTNTGCAETDLEDFEEFGETGEEESLEDDEVVEAPQASNPRREVPEPLQHEIAGRGPGTQPPQSELQTPPPKSCMLDRHTSGEKLPTSHQNEAEKLEVLRALEKELAVLNALVEQKKTLLHVEKKTIEINQSGSSTLAFFKFAWA